MRPIAASPGKAGASSGRSITLAQIGKKIRGATVSAEAALSSARGLLDHKKGGEAAELLSLLPLDPGTAGKLEALLKERRLLDDPGFQTVSFRCALGLGDAPRAKRLFKSVSSNVQALSKEAAAHADAVQRRQQTHDDVHPLCDLQVAGVGDDAADIARRDRVGDDSDADVRRGG